MVHRNLLLRANFLPVDVRKVCVEPASEDSGSDFETDDSMNDKAINELEDVGNEIDEAVHSPACLSTPSNAEETRGLSFGPVSEHVLDGTDVESETQEKVQSSESDTSNGAVHPPACQLSPSMGEETRDSEFRSGSEHVLDGIDDEIVSWEKVQSPASDPHDMNVEEVERDMEKSKPTDGVPGEVVQPSSDMTHTVRTRAGRLIKPVDRLIQIMTQKTLLRSPTLSLLWSKTS